MCHLKNILLINSHNEILKSRGCPIEVLKINPCKEYPNNEFSLNSEESEKKWKWTASEMYEQTEVNGEGNFETD